MVAESHPRMGSRDDTAPVSRRLQRWLALPRLTKKKPPTPGGFCYNFEIVIMMSIRSVSSVIQSDFFITLNPISSQATPFGAFLM